MMSMALSFYFGQIGEQENLYYAFLKFWEPGLTGGITLLVKTIRCIH